MEMTIDHAIKSRQSFRHRIDEYFAILEENRSITIPLNKDEK